MSTKWSFKEQLGRRASTRVESQVPSFSPTDVFVQILDGLPTPVSLALLLKDNGLSLSEAHAAVTRLAAERSIQLTLRPSSLRMLLDQFESMGLTAYAVRNAGRFKVLVPAALVPSNVQQGESRDMSALDALLSEKTVGDLRRIYGKDFARNYRSSAKLSDVLYSMDPAALEAIAARNTGPGSQLGSRHVALS